MKTNQTNIIAMTAALLLTLAGCGDHVDGDGKIVLKEPKPELGKYDSGIRWTVKGPVDASGNPVVLEKVE